MGGREQVLRQSGKERLFGGGGGWRGQAERKGMGGREQTFRQSGKERLFWGGGGR